MASISGMLKVGEAQATNGARMARLRGSSLIYVGVMLGLTVGGMLLALVVGAFVGVGEQDATAWGFLGIAVGVVSYIFLGRYLVLKRFRAEIQKRHSTTEFPLRLELTPDQILYELGGLTHVARWSAVDELFPSHGYWLFSVQSAAFFAPKRLFAGEAEEARFVAEALAYMSPEARGRSVEASRFAAKERGREVSQQSS
jgi:hypothetical protein